MIVRDSGNQHAAPLIAAFNGAFGNAYNHVAIVWDCDAAPTSQLLAEFEDLGYELDTTSGLHFSVAQILPDAPKLETIRPIDGEKDWRQVFALQEMVSGDGYTQQDKAVLRTRLSHLRGLVEKQHGLWLGAFVGKRLVADLGIFYSDGVARFQNVETHPDYRGQGFCRSLLATAIQHVRGVDPKVDIMLEANADSSAERLYRRFGFRTIETIESVFRLTETS